MCPSANPRLMLIVEDEPLMRTNAVLEFEDRGWRVIQSSSAEEALILVDEQTIDVLFTDIQLAGAMNGWDLADRLRKVLPALAVIYTSGNAADRSRRVKGSAFFDKPYDTQSVARVCEDLLS